MFAKSANKIRRMIYINDTEITNLIMDSVLHAVNKLGKNNSSFTSSTNIKNYWFEGKLASNIRNYMA